MAPGWIVEKLDVIENLCSGFIPCFEDLALDALAFEQREEAFRHGIVVTIAFTAHAGFQIVIRQELAPV